MRETLFMETTEISPERTIAEIEAILVRYGATAILKECHGGNIDAVSFKIDIGGVDVPFRLPCRWQAISSIFEKRKAGKWNYTLSVQTKQACADKGRKVAWRQILRWVAAQMALVETSMVKVEEVFFPYIQTRSGKTIYELHQNNLLQLGPGDGR